MKIELKTIKIKDLVSGYIDNQEEGVYGYNGKLNIRPTYQREFIYGEKERNAVIDTVLKGFPLNVMYWNVCGDGSYEIIDGQQRTISICQFAQSDFSISYNNHTLNYGNLADDIQEKFSEYELTVYFCTGTDSERLDWFKTINIAGKELTPQELRNAVYHGSFVTDARKKFSKSTCVAYKRGSDYMTGSPIRQDYLQTVLDWFSNGNIEGYMSQHQHDPDANDLWLYFSKVMDWIETVFQPNKEQKKLMKGLDWGTFYNKYKDKKFVLKDINQIYDKLIEDEDVTSNRGIYPYIITGDTKYLSLRAFDDKQKMKVYKRQKGICALCGKKFEINEMEADHITPWSEGGKTDLDNCQMLCRECNRRKSNK